MEKLPERERTTIKRILRVNHAGEYGAIRIYKAQIMISKLFFPDLVSKLQEFLEHEIEHCITFRTLMPGRNSRPCRAMFLWSWGGFLLGLVTALLGRNSIMTCTAAVEKTVHQHMEDQLAFLKKRDEELEGHIRRIQIQEEEHLSFAESNINEEDAFSKIIYKLVCVSTDCVIFLSTWGDANRMKNDLSYYKGP